MKKIFISYATEDGLDRAMEAKDILEAAGQKIWIWMQDRTLGAPTWREIVKCIADDTELVLFICTASSINSHGQKLEAEYALNNRKKIFTIALDKAIVPPELTAYNYDKCKSNQFIAKCKALAGNLDKVMEKIINLDETLNSEQKPMAVPNLNKYIQDLNARVNSLHQDRVQECKEAMWTSYNEFTLPRQVTNITQELNLTSSNFVTIRLWAILGLRDFNDSSFHWGSYFSDAGRELANGERRYLQRTIIEQVKADSATISRSKPQFEILTNRIQNLGNKGYGPYSLLFPVQLSVDFHKFYNSQINWNARPPLLSIGAIQLKLFHSHKYAPLSDFILLSSRAGTWRIIPDKVTGRAITVALGQSQLYDDKVEYGVETTVSYEVNYPEAFCIIPLSE